MICQQAQLQIFIEMRNLSDSRKAFRLFIIIFCWLNAYVFAFFFQSNYSLPSGLAHSEKDYSSTPAKTVSNNPHYRSGEGGFGGIYSMD